MLHGASGVYKADYTVLLDGYVASTFRGSNYGRQLFIPERVVTFSAETYLQYWNNNEYCIVGLGHDTLIIVKKRCSYSVSYDYGISYMPNYLREFSK